MVAGVARRAVKAAAAVADMGRGPMPGPRILIYHRVTPAAGAMEMEVTPDVFRAHLDHLASGFEVVSLGEALERRGEADAHRLAVLTFDDGYRDVYEWAFPELHRRGLPFVLYLTTHILETGEPLFGRAEAPPLTWDQAGEMVATGRVEVGAHTHTHPDLREVSAEQARDELGISDELIERRLEVRPRHFTYPWGYWSEAADPAVRERYDTATLGSGPPVTADTDAHLVHRVPVQHADGVGFFRRKLAGGMLVEDRIRRRIRGYSGP